MDFGPNKVSIEIINEGAFGGTSFRDIYSNVTGKSYKKSWKEFDHLKNIGLNIIAQIIMMLVLINILLNVENR